MEYQLENAESRIRFMLKSVREEMKAGVTNVQAIKSFIDFEIETLSRLGGEIVDEALVKKGRLADVCADAAGTKKRKSKK